LAEHTGTSADRTTGTYKRMGNTIGKDDLKAYALYIYPLWKRFRKGRLALHGRLGRQSVGWQVGWLEARNRNCLLAITQQIRKQ
jgi:hypothetical protein